MKAICVIPAYNEEKTVATVVKECKRFVKNVLVVDDGSTDQTAQQAEKAGAKVIIQKNGGVGRATKTGLLNALKGGYQIFLIIDADLQHNPQEIPRLLEPLVSGNADVAIGSRFIEHQTNIPKHRFIGNMVLTILTSLFTGLKITDSQCGYRAFTRKALKIIPLQKMDDSFAHHMELFFVLSKYKIKFIEVPVSARYGGEDHTINAVPHFLILVSRLLSFVLKYTASFR